MDFSSLSNININVEPLGNSGGWVLGAFKSFWNQVSSWDFTILKKFFWILLIFGVLYIWYLIWKWKIRFTNLMFWIDYGVKFIIWIFGSWKTKNTFLFAYKWKLENPNWILIANIPYSFVDVPFDSKADFLCVFKDLVQYVRDTNDVEFLKQRKKFVPILFIVDEAQDYLFNRDFKNLSEEVRLLLTQCRKRKIEIDFISQKLSQVDVFLKRLTWIFHEYKIIWKPSWDIRKEYIKDCINVDSNDIDNPNDYSIEDWSILLPSKFSVLFNKDLNNYFEQSYLTNYVVWWKDVYCDADDLSLLNKWDLIYSHRYTWLKAMIDDWFEKINTPLPPKKSIFDSLFKKSDSELDKKIIESQKEMIQKLLKYVPESELSDFSLDNNGNNENS